MKIKLLNGGFFLFCNPWMKNCHNIWDVVTKRRPQWETSPHFSSGGNKAQSHSGSTFTLLISKLCMEGLLSRDHGAVI